MVGKIGYNTLCSLETPNQALQGTAHNMHLFVRSLRFHFIQKGPYYGLPLSSALYMKAPPHMDRSPDQILSEDVYHDAQGFAFRAASWLDLARTSGQFAAFHYSCIDAETLRFLTNPEVPFTNNAGENAIRMTKVQQKVSGCFRSMNVARIFCRIRSFLVTCKKHGLSPAKALSDLFAGKLPDFVT